ncbi:XylR family transcriptional regulator [Chitinophaga sp. 22321]|uniref:XylR family transcriptional regulator n=1 Tax=Chitinophaga hostae TaxID=2831022 RepID=A0ABS5IXE3_9BACT|nr:XylR family transcriptional regulator [Chitinophaga hostae]MBS0027649.1 XylR family transcriptional regulator [Chitinophaga hostae]
MKKKLKIAILLDVSRAYDRGLLMGITNYNRLHDNFVFFFYSPKYIHTDSEEQLVQRISEWQPDGILAREVINLQGLFALNIPIIVAPHTHLYPDKINIWGDDYRVGEMVAGHFISKGYSHFAFLGFKHFQWSLERQKGYVDRIGEAGFEVKAFIFDNTGLLLEHLPSKLLEWLPTLQKPCAVFSATDELSLVLLETIRQTTSKVPDDFSIMGVDNDVMICEMASPTLSSVEHNAARAGYDAALALSKWIRDGEKPLANIVVNTAGIITRNSTNALAIEDEQVRNALYYIAGTAVSEDISVDDVVRSTTISRRILEKRFQQAIRSSIMEEIKKVRINRIKLLLEQSDLTVQQIACELNFRNFDNITRYFKQYTGLTPLEYRSKNAAGAGQH